MRCLCCGKCCRAPHKIKSWREEQLCTKCYVAIRLDA
jgi:hypothetical protein